MNTPEPTPEQIEDAKKFFKLIESLFGSDRVIHGRAELAALLAARDAEKDALIAELRKYLEEVTEELYRFKEAQKKWEFIDGLNAAAWKQRAEQAEVALVAMAKARDGLSFRAELFGKMLTNPAVISTEDIAWAEGVLQKKGIASLREPVVSEEERNMWQFLSEPGPWNPAYENKMRQGIIRSLRAKTVALREAEAEIISHHEEEEQRCGYKKLIEAQAKLAEAEAKIAALEKK